MDSEILRIVLFHLFVPLFWEVNDSPKVSIFKGQFERPAKRWGMCGFHGVMCPRMGMENEPQGGYRISFLLAFLDLEEAQKLDPAPV